MDENELPKAYDPKAHEDDVYDAWMKSGLFNPDNLPNQKGEPYALMMPPPNVTGVLHLGHALENSIMDTMIRFQRMRGKRALLLPGTDHAAIATQAKVEKMLMEQGMKKPRVELGREALVEKIREFAEESKTTILHQIRKLGTSADWHRLAYTFDKPRNKAVNELFQRMFEDGLIYRGYRVVNWSVKGQSTCSDDEIDHVERKSVLYTFSYDKKFPIRISTTRPETKVGDTAVAVHPNDKRYKKYIGKEYTVDFAGVQRKIKIIADESVDPEFGTGALGVTPAHSAIDFAMYEKQKAKGEPIDIVQVIGKDGKMTDSAGIISGKAVVLGGAFPARDGIVSWLIENELIDPKQESGDIKEIEQTVGVSDRFGDVIEAIPMLQWWLDVNKEIPERGKSLRDLMREAVTDGLGGDPEQKVKITPDRFTKLYLDRVENLRDWCLSRQLWWGHRIPAWYHFDPDMAEMYEAEPEKNRHFFEGVTNQQIVVSAEKPEGDHWYQDPDTLDTWFSSGSWTFSTLGWPEKTEDLETFHPTSFMQMGYEILYLWLMRMILMSSYALNQIPFKDAYIHGILRDANGKKFSKSSGNGIDPIEVINQYGADALRISLLLGISPGNDSRYYTEKIEGGRNFVNKLWNISRFVLGFVGEITEEPMEPLSDWDRWILSRNGAVVADVTEKLEKFEFSAAGEILRDFTWNDFADWYLEVAKIQKGKRTDQVLRIVLDSIIKLWHPFMPFVTEVIWEEMHGGMLMIQDWPIPTGSLDSAAELKVTEKIKIIQGVIGAVRNMRSEYKVEPAKQIPATLCAKDAELLELNRTVIQQLARVNDLAIYKQSKKPDGAVASSIVSGVEVYLPFTGFADMAKESARLTKELDEAKKYVASLQAKLENKEFVGKAPAQVVDKMKTNLAEATERVAAIETQLATLAK